MKKLITHIFYGVLCLFFLVMPTSAQIDLSGSNGGAIKLGQLVAACDGTTDGILHWNGTCFEGCISNTLACVTGACDNTPNSFDFTDVSGASTSTLTTSNILQISGTTAACNSTISVSGDRNPEWRLCSNATCSAEMQTWTSDNSSEETQGNYLQVRTTSSENEKVVSSVTINVGSTTNVWNVDTKVTGSCGATPTLGDICPDGTVYAGITPDGYVKMYIARCDIGMIWGGSACTGTRSFLPWNDDNNSDKTFTGFGSNTVGQVNTAGIITMDSDSGTAGVQPHQAAQACVDLNVHGHTDWYLPGFNEMWIIWNNLIEGTPNDNIPDPIISGFIHSNYWTSSEGSSLYADRGNFSTGNSGSWYGGNKHDDLPVRCARQD